MAKGKNSGPFLRGKRGIYYCWIEGRLLSLGTDKPRLAEGVYRRKLIDLQRERELERERSAPRPLTVRECFGLYLEHARSFKSGDRDRRQVLEDFAAEAGPLPHDELTVDRVEAWVARHPGWSRSTARTRIKHLVAAFNFCVRRRRIAANPLAGIAKPRWERRKVVMGGDDQAAILAAARGPFRSILVALRETGARPSELCRAAVPDYRDGMIVLAVHKQDGSGGVRTIHLPPPVRAEVERLVEGRAAGPIWRNSRGDAWTPDTLYCRYKRLRRRLGLAGEGIYPYAERHRFASDAINESDANPAIVARLLGHANMDMLLKHYLHDNPEAARRAIEEIRRAREEGEPPTSPPPAPG